MFHAGHTSDLDGVWFPAFRNNRERPGSGTVKLKMETANETQVGFAAAILLAAGASAIAAEKPGASSMSPGHEMQNSTSSTSKGASGFSPGDRVQDRKGTVGLSKSKGASEYSPGDRINDRRK
jgi:hypothetical protein